MEYGAEDIFINLKEETRIFIRKQVEGKDTRGELPEISEEAGKAKHRLLCSKSI